MKPYKHIFGFTREPFEQDIRAEDAFPLPGLSGFLDRFQYAVECRAISVITGDVGAGKSTSLKIAAAKLHPSGYQTVLAIANAGTYLELLRQIATSMGLESQSHSVTAISTRIRSTIQEIASRKQVPVLIIDEASLIRTEAFAQLHTLLQFDFDSKPLCPLILAGQNNLIDKLMYYASRPLASRIVGRTHLQGLSLKDMQAYLVHHLKLAGIDTPLFPEEAIVAIHQSSGGILRRANQLAKGALIAAAQANTTVLSPDHVRLAATEII